MSNISDRHSFVTYVATGAAKTAAFSGQRLSVVRFKKDKNGKKPMDSQAVSVPVIQLTDANCQDLIVYINEWFAGCQDAIIRDACEAGKREVTDDDISVAAVKSYLIAQAAGERMTGDAIRNWFDVELSDLMTVAFADKLGFGDSLTEEQSKKLEQMVNVYRDKFASMAGGRTMFDAATRQKLAKALELADCNEGIGQKLAAKLRAMNEVKIEEMLDL
jgi:hypothetical protein